MSMSERLDSAPQKRLKTLEAQAKEAQRTIEELRARTMVRASASRSRATSSSWVESELGQGSRFFFTLPLNPQRD